MKRFLKFLGWAVVSVYCVGGIGLYLFQDKILYLTDISTITPDTVKPPTMTVEHLKTEDNLSLIALYQKPAKLKNNHYMPTIILFHGNGGTIDYPAYRMRNFIALGYGILAVEYRGFNHNAGKPSEAGLFLDAKAGLSFVKDKTGNQSPLIYYGLSLGTGVAVKLAKYSPPAALILESSYTSILDVANQTYFMFPVRFMLKDRFDSLSIIKDVHAPLLILHGEKDMGILVAHAQKLYDAANEPKDIYLFEGLGHVDIMERGGEKYILEWIKTTLSL